MLNLATGKIRLHPLHLGLDWVDQAPYPDGPVLSRTPITRSIYHLIQGQYRPYQAECSRFADGSRPIDYYLQQIRQIILRILSAKYDILSCPLLLRPMLFWASARSAVHVPFLPSSLSDAEIWRRWPPWQQEKQTIFPILQLQIGKVHVQGIVHCHLIWLLKSQLVQPKWSTGCFNMRALYSKHPFYFSLRLVGN